MVLSEADERFLQTTRGRVIALLRKQERTIQELAEELNLTDNGVRAQLATLERDGIVRPVSTRRSSRKPARVYALVPEAEERLSSAYPPFAVELCARLAATMPEGDRIRTMQEVGARLAGDRRIPAGDGLTRGRA